LEKILTQVKLAKEAGLRHYNVGIKSIIIEMEFLELGTCEVGQAAKQFIVV